MSLIELLLNQTQAVWWSRSSNEAGSALFLPGNRSGVGSGGGGGPSRGFYLQLQSNLYWSSIHPQINVLDVSPPSQTLVGLL